MTDVEVIQRLLAFNDDLKQAYRYYQDLILAINHRSKDELNHFKKFNGLSGGIVKRLSPALNMVTTRMVQSKELTSKIKVIKRTAYGFCNFFNFRARILLALPNSYFAINWKNKRTAHVQSQTRAV